MRTATENEKPLSSGPAPRGRTEGGGGARWGGGAFSQAADTHRGAASSVGSPAHRAFPLLARWRRRQQVPKALQSPHRVPNDPEDETPLRSDHSPRRQTQKSWIQARKRFRISISRRSGGPPPRGCSASWGGEGGGAKEVFSSPVYRLV